MRQMLRDARYNTLAVLVGVGTAALRSMLLLRFLGPSLIGAWKSALLLELTGQWIREGICRVMGARVTMLDAQERETEAAAVARATAGIMLWFGVTLATVALAASMFVETPEMRYSLWLVAVVIAVTQPNNFVRDLSGARMNFDLRSKETILRGMLDLVGVAALCYWFGFAGMAISTLTALAASTVYLLRNQAVEFTWFPDRERAMDILKTGLPFSMFEAAYELTRRLDVVVQALVLGPKTVGLYGVSLLIMDFAMVLAQKGVSHMVSPHMFRELGRSGSRTEAAQFYRQPARLFSYLLPAVIGPGTFFIPGFVALLLPQYMPGVQAAQVTLWTIVLVTLHSSVNSFFVAAGLLPKVVRYFAAIIPLGALAQYFVAQAGWGLTGAAWCTLAVLGVTAIVEYTLAARATYSASFSETVIHLIGLLGPTLYGLALCVALNDVSFSPQWGAAARAALFLVLYSPVFLLWEHRFAVLRSLREPA